MKRYCYMCQRLFDEGEMCPKCHFYHLRDVQENDPVKLTETDYMRAEMLAGLLEDAHIYYDRSGSTGGVFGMTVPMRWDKIRFYVPYGSLAQAQELVDMLETSFEPIAADDAEEQQMNENEE